MSPLDGPVGLAFTLAGLGLSLGFAAAIVAYHLGEWRRRWREWRRRRRIAFTYTILSDTPLYHQALRDQQLRDEVRRVASRAIARERLRETGRGAR